MKCPFCSNETKLIKYGTVRRKVRSSVNLIYWVKLRRYFCCECERVHRSLPSFLLPYKQYEKWIIEGITSGDIVPYELDFEDYPCKTTVRSWLKEYTRKLQGLL